MKQLRFIGLFRLVMLFLFGCEKIDQEVNPTCTNDCTIINGFINTEDEVPVANVKVDLYAVYKQTWDGYFSKTDKIASTLSDIDGKYSILFFVKNSYLDDSDDFLYLKYSYNDTTLYETNRTDNIGKLQRRDSLFHRFHLERKARLNITLTNPQNMDTQDRISCDVWVKFLFRGQSIKNIMGSFSGKMLSQTVNAAGNEMNYITIRKKKGSFIEESLDSLFVSKDSVISYKLKY